MIRLRSQVRFARQAYRSARYPGDLSAEILPDAGANVPGGHRWILLTGVGATAAAAALMLTLLMSRVSDLPLPRHGDPARGALVDWLPFAPDSLPLPKFQSDAPPVPGMAAPAPPPVLDGTRNLALPNLKLDLPPLPDLPARGVQWLRNAWRSIESA